MARQQDPGTLRVIAVSLLVGSALIVYVAMTTDRLSMPAVAVFVTVDVSLAVYYLAKSRKS